MKGIRYDTIDHNVLLGKIAHMGFRGVSHNYITSYLENRKQRTQVGNNKSSERIITKGVPQGSVMGPFLFCLGINDIFKAIKDAEAVLFADDAAFFIVAKDIGTLYERIRRMLADLSRYLNCNMLVPNLSKSKLMFFSSRPHPPMGLEDILFRNEKLEWVNEYKYLGLILSNKMSYARHIDKVCTRVSQYTGVFYHLNKILPRNVLMLLYHSHIVPHISLHIEIWGAAPEQYISKLSIKQNKLLRAILNVLIINGRPMYPTINMYRDLKVLTTKCIFKLQLFKFLLRMLKGSLPSFYNLLLNPLLTTHQYQTRGGNYRHPLITSEVERRAVAHQIIILMESVEINDFLDLSMTVAVNKYREMMLVQ